MTCRDDFLHTQSCFIEISIEAGILRSGKGANSRLVGFTQCFGVLCSESVWRSIYPWLYAGEFCFRLRLQNLFPGVHPQVARVGARVQCLSIDFKILL
jgi:hypothetical protein